MTKYWCSRLIVPYKWACLLFELLKEKRFSVWTCLRNVMHVHINIYVYLFYITVLYIILIVLELLSWSAGGSTQKCTHFPLLFSPVRLWVDQNTNEVSCKRNIKKLTIRFSSLHFSLSSYLSFSQPTCHSLNRGKKGSLLLQVFLYLNITSSGHFLHTYIFSQIIR